MRLIPVDDAKTKRPPPSGPGKEPAAERRRIGRVIHDDRGAGSVEWVDAPVDFKRVKLSIEEANKPGEGYNPYARDALPRQRADARSDGRKVPARRDLRKLSEWIKQMRDLEERKRRGEPEE